MLEGRRELERLASTPGASATSSGASRGAGEGLFGGEPDDAAAGDSVADEDLAEDDAELRRQDAQLQRLVQSLKMAKERGAQALSLAQCAVGGRV